MANSTSSIVLNSLEASVLDKAWLTVNDLYSFKRVNDNPDKDPVTYIKFDWVLKQGSDSYLLSISVYDNDKWVIQCFKYNLETEIQEQVPAKWFISLVKSLTKSTTETSDDLD